MHRYGVLVIIWAVWCCLHSFMITPSIVELVQRRFKKANRYYRLFYNFIASITLIPVLLYYFSIKGPLVFQWEGPLRVVQAVLAVSALVLFIVGARRYDMAQFLGISQIRGNGTCHVLKEDCSLDTGGVLGVVRHPWYAGGILAVWARHMNMADILTNVVLTAYFVTGALLEERKLVKEFGEEYRAYQKRVSMLFPLKHVIRKWKAKG